MKEGERENDDGRIIFDDSIVRKDKWNDGKFLIKENGKGMDKNYNWNFRNWNEGKSSNKEEICIIGVN